MPIKLVTQGRHPCCPQPTVPPTPDTCSLSCLKDTTLLLFTGIFFFLLLKVLLCMDTSICMIVFIVFKSYIYLFSLCVHTQQEEVGRQTAGVVSFFHYVGPQAWQQAS